MQSRFSLRQRKRVLRTLSHPRFRAAWDFLLLRGVASDAHAEDIAFWRDAQGDPDHAIASHPAGEEGGEGEPGAPRKRRRRRRRSAATAD